MKKIKEVKVSVDDTAWMDEVPYKIRESGNMQKVINYIKKKKKFLFMACSHDVGKSLTKTKKLKPIDDKATYSIKGEVIGTLDDCGKLILVDCGLMIGCVPERKDIKVGDYVTIKGAIYGGWLNYWCTQGVPEIKGDVKKIKICKKGLWKNLTLTLSNVENLPLTIRLEGQTRIIIKQPTAYKIRLLKEKTITFKQLLKKINKPCDLEKLEVSIREFLPQIEKELNTNKNHHIISNLLELLRKEYYEASDKTIKSMLEKTLTPNPENLKYLPQLCDYIITFNKKQYCGILKKILYKYGTEEYLVKNTHSFPAYAIHAIGQLKCTGCKAKLKKIINFGTKMNGFVLYEAAMTKRILERNKK